MDQHVRNQLLKPSYKSATFYGRSFVAVMSMLAASGIIKPQSVDVAQNIVDTASVVGPQAVQLAQVIINGAVQLVGLITGSIVMLKQGKEQTDIKTAYIDAAKKS
jgi:hypothetical protein